MKKHPDTVRLDWLARLQGDGLINDDAGRWAISDGGIQNVPDHDKATDIATTLFIPAKAWHPTIRKAIDAAMKKERDEEREDAENGNWAKVDKSGAKLRRQKQRNETRVSRVL